MRASGRSLDSLESSSERISSASSWPRRVWSTAGIDGGASSCAAGFLSTTAQSQPIDNARPISTKARMPQS